jgi:hypothetical protein
VHLDCRGRDQPLDVGDPGPHDKERPAPVLLLGERYGLALLESFIRPLRRVDLGNMENLAGPAQTGSMILTKA